MRKRRVEEVNHNTERWLLTYADMITLLMAFFIMMYSMSILNLAKFKQVAISIRSGFNGVMQGQGRSILARSGFTEKDTPAEGNYNGVSVDVLKPLVAYAEAVNKTSPGGVSVSKDFRGIVITMRSDSMLFDPGKATLKTKVYPLLDTLAETIDQVSNSIQIEGHTCNLPTGNKSFPSNWELSCARASSVVRYFVERKGIDPRRFTAAGYGSSKPRAPNDSPVNRAKNRRVEIVILHLPADDFRQGKQTLRETTDQTSDSIQSTK